MLNKKLKGAAEMYALGCISIKDVVFLTGLKEAEIPEEFYAYADSYYKEYEKYCNIKSVSEV